MQRKYEQNIDKNINLINRFYLKNRLKTKEEYGLGYEPSFNDIV
ncbi:MAG: hypothetical protein ACOC3V_04140 [bacterium]